ncbi:MAG: PAS domain S-box protein [Anaerolineales bacterium]|nr:PAS domain S-box protein [Anaerolineales bacterium]
MNSEVRPMGQLTKSLETEVDLLRKRVADLETALVQTDVTPDRLRLADRTKELSTLYRESYLADQQRAVADDYFIELMALLPLGWQYVNDACARLLIQGQIYATPNFQETPWQQSSTIVVQGKQVGILTIGYLSPHPPLDEGAFLSEERSLINEIAKRIGRFIERRQTETSHRFLAAIVESSHDAIVSMTLDGVIQTWNRAAERIYGYTVREVLDKSIATFLEPGQFDEILRLLQRTRDGYQTEQFETNRRHKDGREVFVSISLYPIHDELGKIVGAAAIARDISDRRVFESTLRETDARLRSTFEQAAVGLAHVNLDWRFLRVNQKLCAILGYSAAELLSLTVQQISHSDDLAVEHELLRALLAGECPTYSIEKRDIRKDGAIVWVNRTVSLARDDAQQPKYFILVVEDISSRKEVERARTESEARYHELFENSPISLWEQDFSGVKRALETLRSRGVTDFRTYLEDHTGVVMACLAQVKMLSFNRASLELYGASNRDELLASLDRLVPAAGYPLFIEELVWIAEGRTAFVWEGVNRKLSGEHIHVRLHWSAAPGHEQLLDRVLVSIEAIDENCK